MINSVILPTVYGCVVYWVCNLRPTAAAFFSYLLAFYLTISAAQSMGLFLSVLIPNSKIALLLAPMLCLSLFILGGFYMPLNLIPPSLEWYSWISMARWVQIWYSYMISFVLYWLSWTIHSHVSFYTVHRYGFPALVIIEFGGRDIPCSESDANDSSMQCPQSGADVLASFGIEGVWANLWLNVLVLLVLQVVLRVLTYALLRRSKWCTVL